MLTGYLKYKDINHSFVFDENKSELQIIPVEAEKVASSVTIRTNDLPKMNDPYLIGTINENHHKIVFVTIQGSYVRRVNNVLYIRLYAYFIYNSINTEAIDKITFCSPEIDHIFSVNRAFSFVFKDVKDFNRNGTVTIETNDFDSTTSHTQSFKVSEKDVNVSFQINRTISTEIGKPPLALQSCLCFEFEATEDYSFIIDLCHYARNFIRYLCFRKNIFFTSVDIYKPVEETKHLNIGEICFFDSGNKPEIEPLSTSRCIKYEYIAGFEGRILSDIVSNSLYLRHLPKTFEDGKHIDVSSFIMITAAFEWEFSRNYPKGIIKSDSTIKAEDAVSDAINDLLSKSTGKQKNIYKFLLRLVKSDSMQSEIIQFGKDYSDIIGVFGEHLYSLNHVIFDYKEIGKRVSDQRNHFAHGDLDKDFINEALLDVIFMEYIVYTLQLKSFGLTEDNIRKAINDVFHLNFAL